MDKTAQAPRFLTSPLLQFSIAESLLGAHLCSQHIRLLHDKAGGRRQGQQVLQRQGPTQRLRQLRRPAGISQEGIQLLQRHGIRHKGGSVLTGGADGCVLARRPAELQTCGNRRGTMRSSPSPSEPEPTLPTWMRRGGAALTALLAVLFTVLMLQVRQQGQRLQSLQDRLQILENNQDLERTNALEEQLRSTVQRLQNLEGMAATLQRLSSEQESLRQQLRSSSAAANKDRRDPEPLPLPEPAPAPQPGP
ncbi:MAG: hypothetical protein RLZZ611_2161 [Cyanobacteriota bacterium]